MSRLLSKITAKPRVRGGQATDRIKGPILYAAKVAIVTLVLRFNILLCGRRFGKTVMITERVIDGAKKKYKMAILFPQKMSSWRLGQN